MSRPTADGGAPENRAQARANERRDHQVEEVRRVVLARAACTSHRCMPHSWRLPCRTLHVSCWIVLGHLARSHSPASTCRKPPATQAGSTPGRPRAATVVRRAAAACGRTCRNSERPRLYRRATQISLDEPDHALRALQRSELFDGWKQAAWPQMHARARADTDTDVDAHEHTGAWTQTCMSRKSLAVK